MSLAQHAMIVGHCAIHLGGWGATSPPATCRVKVQRICILRYLNLGQQYVDGYAFFHVHCSTKSQENPKDPQFSILKLMKKENVYVL